MGKNSCVWCRDWARQVEQLKAERDALTAELARWKSGAQHEARTCTSCEPAEVALMAEASATLTALDDDEEGKD